MKILSIFLLIIISLSAYSQNLTVDEVEKEWNREFRQGYAALKDEDYPKAENLFSMSRNLMVSNGMLNSIDYYKSTVKLAETFFFENKSAELQSLEKEMKETGVNLNPGSRKYIDYLLYLGQFYMGSEQFPEAIQALEKGLASIETLGKRTELRSSYLDKLALCNYCNKNTDKAIEIENQCVELDGELKYKESLMHYLHSARNYDRICDLLPSFFKEFGNQIIRNFTRLDNTERASLWSESGLFFTKFLPLCAIESGSDSLVAYSYDAMLLGKGILLNASNKSDEIIEGSGDKGLIDLYAHYKQLNKKQEPTIEDKVELETLSDIFRKYIDEHESQFFKSFQVRWTDVLHSLKNDEMAVEFIKCPSPEGKSIYAALTLKSSYSCPKLTILFNESQLKGIPRINYYKTAELYNLIWKPLENELKGVRHVYFSPTGMMHNVGIEYLLKETTGKPLNENLKLSRLSSTKELVFSTKGKAVKEASLFGGLDFDNTDSKSDIAQTAQESDSQNRGLDFDPLSLRSLTSVEEVNYLPGTKEEVFQIDRILSKYGVSTHMHCGTDGTESELKSLSGKDIDILHIATHGFMYTEKNKKQKQNIDEIFKDLNLHNNSEEIEVIDEDKMLTRSGLILSGANITLRKKSTQPATDDGILYADEVSIMNLNHVKLLVMSACQSGLGDIDDSEGVFGLQRGFKRAGVHSIIMSLWKVDDSATTYLMEKFYSNLAQGLDYPDALANAQKALRVVEGGKYSAPYYWAAFVLLDGI